MYGSTQKSNNVMVSFTIYMNICSLEFYIIGIKGILEPVVPNAPIRTNVSNSVEYREIQWLLK